MSTTTTTAAALAIAASGRTVTAQELPLFVVGDAPKPSDSTDGLGIPTGTLVAEIDVSIRKLPGERCAWCVIPDDTGITSTYDVDVAGNTVQSTQSSETTAFEMCETIASDVNADVTVGAIVTATAITTWRDDGTTAAAVQLVGKDGSNWSFDFTAASDTVEAYAEPETASLDVYVKTRATISTANQPARYAGLDAQSWCIANLLSPAAGIALDSQTAGSAGSGSERLDVSGYAAVYPRVYDMAGVSGDGASVDYVAFAQLYTGEV